MLVCFGDLTFFWFLFVYMPIRSLFLPIYFLFHVVSGYGFCVLDSVGTFFWFFGLLLGIFLCGWFFFFFLLDVFFCISLLLISFGLIEWLFWVDFEWESFFFCVVRSSRGSDFFV